MDPNMKILIVDDFAAMRSIVKSALNTLGYKNTDDAQDGTAALAKLKSGSYQFVVTDWNMPNMNGLDLIKAIRSEPSLKKLRILMITTLGEPAKMVPVIQAGVNSYLKKPYTIDELKTKIEQIFA
ncbi:MAG TPA: response regulator [Nitrospirota bacterium]|nr:response regulator [Nitrospirota bacterium]